jgi:hypothetical protein
MPHLLLLNLGSLEWLVIAVILLAYPALVIYCLTSITRSHTMPMITKVVWVVLMIAAPFVGSILYLLIGKERNLPPKDRY